MSTRTLTFTFSGAVSDVSAGTAPAAAVEEATGMGGRLTGMDGADLGVSNGVKDIRSFWGGLSGVAAAAPRPEGGEAGGTSGGAGVAGSAGGVTG
jgi:hypothetical protein